MRVIKPQVLSFLGRPFEYRRKIYYGFGILCLIPLDESRRLLAEAALWPLAQDVLGQECVLDVGIPKSQGEFLVAGSAFTRAADRTKVRVRCRLGGQEKSLNVLGDRRFEGERPTAPTEFDAMPLIWHKAFGGEGFSANPIGKGYAKVIAADGKKYFELPNIEYPGETVVCPGARCRPAGFGALDIMHPDRQKMAGTYDQKWLKEHYPAIASDIDWGFFNLASRDQYLSAGIELDAPYELEGMHPERSLIKGHLPDISARCFIRRRESRDGLEELATRLTTVWFFPDREHAVLVYHASTEVNDPNGLDIGEVMLAADYRESQRNLAHYVEIFGRRLDEDQGPMAALDDRGLMPIGMSRKGLVNPDELIQAASEGARTRNIREQLEREREEASELLKSKMAELGVEIPEKKGPDLGIDLARVSDYPVQDLVPVIDRLEELSRQVEKDLKQEQIDGKKRLKAAMDELQSRVPDMEMSQPSATSGPPAFNADSTLKQIEEALLKSEAKGIDVNSIRDVLLSEDRKKLMHSAEVAMIENYRRYGHHQNPAEPRPGNDVHRLLKVLEGGESPDGLDFTGARLAGIDLAGRDLSGIFLESADLSGAKLTDVTLNRAVLAGCDLRNAVLRNASLIDANLGRSNLQGADLSSSDLRGSVLEFANAGDCSFQNANLEGANLRGLILEGASFRSARLGDVLLMDQELRKVDFSGAMMPQSLFMRVLATEVNFAEANLSGSVFLACKVRDASFSSAVLLNLRVVEECDFSGVSFTDATLTESNFRGALLQGSNFERCQVQEADFSDCDLSDAVFRMANAQSARFVSSNMHRADFSAANLMHASLERAEALETSFFNANLYAADLARIHVDRKTVFDGALTDRMRTYPRKFRAESS